MNEIFTGVISEVTVLGPWVKARNNIFLNSSSRHVVFQTSGEKSMYDGDYNTYYPDTGSKFNFSYVGDTNLAGIQAGSKWDWVLEPNSTITDPKINSVGVPDGSVTLIGIDMGDDLLLACEAEFKTGTAPGYFPLLNPDRWGWPKGFCIDVALNTSSGL